MQLWKLKNPVSNLKATASRSPFFQLLWNCCKCYVDAYFSITQETESLFSLVCSKVWITGVLVVFVLEPFGIQSDYLRRLAALRVLRLGRLARAVRTLPMFHEHLGSMNNIHF